MALRYGTALIAVILGLLLGVRPIINALRGPRRDEVDEVDGDETKAAPGSPASPIRIVGQNTAQNAGQQPGNSAQDDLREQVDLARRLANEQPERAAAALRRMLAAPAGGA